MTQCFADQYPYDIHVCGEPKGHDGPHDDIKACGCGTTWTDDDDRREVYKYAIAAAQREAEQSTFLREIANILGPYSEMERRCGCCEGCAYEADEALMMTNHMLAGIPTTAHLGAGHSKQEFIECSKNGSDKCPVCIAHPGVDYRQAWTDAGLHWINKEGEHVNMPKSWHRLDDADK